MVLVAPVQTVEEPTMAVGVWYTVNAFVEAQPVLVYDKVTVPPATPYTTPVVLIDATAVLLLLHTPPVVEQVTVAVLPEQTVVAPPMALGTAFTVTALVWLGAQPVAYVIVTAPAVKPYTIPAAASTDARVATLDVQVPPVTVLVSVVAEPIQTADAPPTAAGAFATIIWQVALVSVPVALQVPVPVQVTLQK